MTTFSQRIDGIQQHFFKRIHDGDLRILVKTAIFADTKT